MCPITGTEVADRIHVFGAAVDAHDSTCPEGTFILRKASRKCSTRVLQSFATQPTEAFEGQNDRMLFLLLMSESAASALQKFWHSW